MGNMGCVCMAGTQGVAGDSSDQEDSGGSSLPGRSATFHKVENSSLPPSSLSQTTRPWGGGGRSLT